MTRKETNCEAQRIELFFRQELSDAELATFESHLEMCVHCRQALETGAAQAEDWAVVRESLGSADSPLDDLEFDSAVSKSSSTLHDQLSSDSGDESLCRPDSVLNFLSPSDDPRMMGRLGSYEIVGIVGQGGMGVVFKGLDPALNRYVAIKALAPHLAASGAARRRFAREAQAAAAVNHDNVVAIHGVAEWNGLPYLVMPYVRGESLQKRIDQQGPCGLSEILRVGLQIAAGLTAAHAQGLVHRDIKPANILLEDGVERLKITDFGLARAVDDASLTRTGIIAGTPQYMSPEQARGEAIDSRSDLFSLGSVLYAMCTGRPPFRAETSYGILRRITDTEPRPIREVNPDIPEWLDGIIKRLLAKDPNSRFSTANDVAAVFEQCLAHVQQPTIVALPVVCQATSRWTAFRVGSCIAAVVVMLLCGVWSVVLVKRQPSLESRTEVSSAPEPSRSVTSTLPESQPESSSGRADNKTDLKPGEHWDDASVQMERLTQDGAQLQRRTEKFWDAGIVPLDAK
jgi:serine/threonine protein kinase